MGKKSFKAFAQHHTKTNKRNVIRNQGGIGARNSYWKNQFKREKNKRKVIKKHTKNLIENTLIILVILGIIFGMCYFN